MKKIVLIATEGKDYTLLIKILRSSFPGIEVMLLRKEEKSAGTPAELPLI